MAKQRARVTLDLTVVRVDDEECTVDMNEVVDGILDEYFGSMTLYMDGEHDEEMKFDVEDVVKVRVFEVVGGVEGEAVDAE